MDEVFSDELNTLSRGRSLNLTSSILSLSPFIGKNALIRVGGRLINLDLSFDAHHPILLPRDHILTRRVIEREHKRNAHAGVQATIAAIGWHFWPISLLPEK